MHLNLAVAVSLTDNQAADQSRNARDQVDDEAASEVEGAELCADPTTAPDPVGDRRIDQSGPEKAKDEIAGEFDPLGESS